MTDMAPLSTHLSQHSVAEVERRTERDQTFPFARMLFEGMRMEGPMQLIFWATVLGI